MMRRFLHKSNAGAFTLLEMLVALVIFATLIGALYAVFFSGMHLREASWKDFESGVLREQVTRTIRRDLRNAVVPAGILAGSFVGQTQSANQVRSDTLTFYSTTGAITDKAPWGDIQSVEYFLTDPIDPGKSGEYDFVRRVRQNLLATNVEEEDVPEAQWRLLSGVTSLTIQYYDGQAWNDSWDSTTVSNANPQAVQMTLTFAPDSDGRTRPPLEIECEVAAQPRATAAPAVPASPSGSGASTGGGQS